MWKPLSHGRPDPTGRSLVPVFPSVLPVRDQAPLARLCLNAADLYMRPGLTLRAARLVLFKCIFNHLSSRSFVSHTVHPQRRTVNHLLPRWGHGVSGRSHSRTRNRASRDVPSACSVTATPPAPGARRHSAPCPSVGISEEISLSRESLLNKPCYFILGPSFSAEPDTNPFPALFFVSKELVPFTSTICFYFS